MMVMMFVGVVFAQVQKPSKEMNWRKRLKLADKYYEQQDYASAAAFYESILDEKPKKLEIAYKAGEAFAKIRNFKSAADAYQKARNGEFDKIGYKYAVALKQSGNYAESKTVFKNFISNYSGADSDVMKTIVQQEIKGCELAQTLQSDPPKGNMEVEHLSRIVNSDAKEYAPIPFLDNLLYYSSMKEGASQIFRTERTSAGWEKPVKPQIFGSMEKQHFGHGSFTPDRKAFYFTQCERDNQGEMVCEIYIMQRKNNKWLKPVKLPEYINESGSSATQPFVTKVDNKELLYFSSNRKGGKGGYDLYFVTRDFGTSDFNYSLPVNLGDNVNSVKDDMTPYYDVANKELYFSSNGLPGVGGLDVFKVSGDRSSWGEPTNLGFPTNSMADDYYYILKSDKQSGYFVSNRLEGTSKTFTDNNDLFHFKKKEIEVVIRGNIFEKDNPNKKLDNVVVDLYEVIGGGQKTPLVTKVFDEGFYQFSLMPNKKYSIEAERDGYLAAFFEVSTSDFNSTSEYTQDISLEASSIASIQPGRSETHTKPPGNTEIVEPESTEEEEFTKIDPDLPPGVKKETIETEVTTTPPPVTYPEEVEETEPEVETEIAINPPGNSATIEKPTVEETRIETTKPTEEVTQPITQTSYPSTINFSELDKTQINSIFYMNDKPYIRDNGVLVEVIGLNDTEVASSPEVDPVPETTIEEPTDAGVIKIKDEGFPSEVSGVNYKIQLVAVTTYKEYKFKSVQHLGGIELEPTISKNGLDINRVLLTPFSSHTEAKQALTKVRRSGFKKAQIIRYENGERATRVR